MIEREFSLDSIEAGGWNPVVIEGFRLLNKAIAEVGGIPEIIKVSYEMNEQLRSLNITDDEFKRIVQAESVLWAAMTDESAIGNQARCDAEKRDIQTGVLLRKDKNVVPWHSYAVALYGLRRDGLQKGDVETVIIKLLHDTVEDSGGKITNDILASIFGAHTARTVDLMTKVDEEEGENHEKTLKKLIELIKHDPRGLIAKGDDRINYWETARPMSQASLRQKTWETQYYSAFMSALGFHKDAQLLAEYAANALHFEQPHSFLVEKEKFIRWQRIYSALLQGKSSEAFSDIMMQRALELHKDIDGDWIDSLTSEPRLPNFYDAIKAIAETDVDLLNSTIREAELPLIVPIIVKAEPYDNKGPDAWRGHVVAFARWLASHGYLPEYALTTLNTQLNTEHRDVHLRFQQDGIPCMMIFIRQEDELLRRVTYYDRDSADTDHRNASDLKIDALQQTYVSLQYPGASNTVEDMLFCLKEGAKIISVNGREIGVSANATALDVIYASAKSDKERIQIARGIRVRTVSDRRFIRLQDVVDSPIEYECIHQFPQERGKKIRRRKLREHASDAFYSLTPDWFEQSKMPTTKRQIGKVLFDQLIVAIATDDAYYKKKFKNRYGPDVVEECRQMRIRIRKSGVDVLKKAFTTLADELGYSHIRSMELPFILLNRVYDPKNDLIAFTNDSTYSLGLSDRTLAKISVNFIYKMALRAYGYELDNGHTSIPWRVARLLLHEQAGLKIIYLKIPDQAGELDKRLVLLRDHNINIKDINKWTDYTEDQMNATVAIAVSNADYIALQKLKLGKQLGIISEQEIGYWG